MDDHRMRAATLLTLLTVATLVSSGCSSDDPAVTSDVPATTTIAATVPPTTVPPATSTTSTSSTTTSTTTSTTLPPTTTMPPIVTEGAIVLVANASGVPGAAAKLSNKFEDFGFTTVAPVNAAGADEDLAISRIYADEASQPVALSIARLMGDIAVLPMPTPIPVDGASAGEATVVVMLGHDLAGKRLPGA